MSIERRSLERIASEFPASEQSSVSELLSSYCGPEMARVVWDILELSAGSLEKVRQFVAVAQKDYRDVIYWAEYYEDDPMLRRRDPKELVDDLLARWGNR